MPTKPNVWEFVRNENGSYAVFQNGKLLADAIPEQRREDEFCIRFGFCGHEYEEIVRRLRQSGKCTLDLGSLDYLLISRITGHYGPQPPGTD